MSKAYYYFAATLPMIQMGGKLPFTVKDFLSSAERLLSSEDYALLQALLTDQEFESKNTTASKWLEFDRQFRNALSVYRASKANKDPFTYVRGDYFEDPHFQSVIQQTEKAGDPLEAEKILSQERWRYLEELASGHYFDLDFIITYGLKLKILDRYAAIQSPKGKEIYEELKKIDFPEGVLK